MGRMYSVIMDAVSVSVAKDLLRLSAPSDSGLKIHEVTVTQEGSEISDQVAVQLQRSSTDGTGTSATPEELGGGGATFGGTAATNLTADTTISGAPLRREGFNMLAGYSKLFTPEERIGIAPSGRFVVRLDVAPAAATTLTVEVVFEAVEE